jgi:DNA repair exonuclease SbcCD ATPase subunit
MHTISNTIERKFVNSIDLSNLEIETDNGWQPVTAIHKTVPYTVWKIKTASGLSLDCADTHILFDKNFNEIFTKDLIENQTEIITENGFDLVTKVSKTNTEENMFDLTVDHPNHRFYTNGILSHNTTIINALSYALYGQALTNIKRNNLINKTNSKGMLVTLTFEKNNTEYRIERGRSPNVLKFFKNNKEQIEENESQGDSRKTQEEISSLLGMSHDMFKHIVALNTYSEPFLSMKASDQRAIIEQLLGITILTEKSESLKEQIRASKDAIVEETLKIEAIQTANEKIQTTIDNLKKNQRAWQSKKRQDEEKLQSAIEELEKLDINAELEAHERLQNWTDLNNAVTALNKERSTLDAALLRADKSAEKAKKDIADLDDAVCYTCGQELHADKKAEIFARKTKEVNEAVEYQQEVAGKLQKVTEQLDEIGDINGKPNTFYDTAKEAYKHQNNVLGLKQSLQSKQDEIDPYQSQIDELNETAMQEINWSTVNDITQFKEHQEFLLKLLTNKDSFIRKKIIDQNLAYLNNRLTYYLDRLGLPHQVIFQNDLTVEITQLGQDLDFDNLSRGERNRLILGLSFAFRDVWESLYQNINLLFIDELIDSGMDSSGVENSLSVLKKMCRERKKNIYLISHKDELVGRVNNVLKVIKENGYTSYADSIDIVD